MVGIIEWPSNNNRGENKMKRKDLEMIAGVLNNYVGFQGYKVNQDDLVEAISKQIAVEIKNNDPRFDAVQFFKACTKGLF